MFLTYLECTACGLRHDWSRLQNLCTACSKPLFAVYDLAAVGKLDRFKQPSLREREKSLWRYREFLPLPQDAEPISLGEGGTPLLHAKAFSDDVDLWIKDESLNPTQGFKARGMSVAISMAKFLGAKKLAVPSAGNAGGGTGLIGMWKAFDEMEKVDWIDNKRPRMFSVQASGCAPIVRAFESGEKFAAEFPNAHTVASGLRVPKAIGDFLMLNILRES